MASSAPPTISGAPNRQGPVPAAGHHRGTLSRVPVPHGLIARIPQAGWRQSTASTSSDAALQRPGPAMPQHLRPASAAPSAMPTSTPPRPPGAPGAEPSSIALVDASAVRRARLGLGDKYSVSDPDLYVFARWYERHGVGGIARCRASPPIAPGCSTLARLLKPWTGRPAAGLTGVCRRLRRPSASAKSLAFPGPIGALPGR